MGAFVGVDEKKIDTHEYGSPQIKNRGSHLRARTGIALSTISPIDVCVEYGGGIFFIIGLSYAWI